MVSHTPQPHLGLKSNRRTSDTAACNIATLTNVSDINDLPSSSSNISSAPINPATANGNMGTPQTHPLHQNAEAVMAHVMNRWQYHLIGRIDDVVHHFITDLQSHGGFDFALQTRRQRSKNIGDEDEYRNQILLGSNNDRCCVLIALTIHLESYPEAHPYSRHLFCRLKTDNEALHPLAIFKHHSIAC